MCLALAADHAGYTLKEILRNGLQAMGQEVLDLGCHDPTQPDDSLTSLPPWGRPFRRDRSNVAI
jgi:ribose 5-phosphate isomerase RpiB